MSTLCPWSGDPGFAIRRIRQSDRRVIQDCSGASPYQRLTADFDSALGPSIDNHVIGIPDETRYTRVRTTAVVSVCQCARWNSHHLWRILSVVFTPLVCYIGLSSDEIAHLASLENTDWIGVVTKIDIIPASSIDQRGCAKRYKIRLSKYSTNLENTQYIKSLLYASKIKDQFDIVICNTHKWQKKKRCFVRAYFALKTYYSTCFEKWI